MSLSLYTMTSEWQRVFEMLEDPEIPDEAVFDTIESIELRNELMDEKAIQALIVSRSAELAKMIFRGERAEIMGVKDGVRIFRIRREEVKQ